MVFLGEVLSVFSFIESILLIHSGKLINTFIVVVCDQDKIKVSPGKMVRIFLKTIPGLDDLTADIGDSADIDELNTILTDQLPPKVVRRSIITLPGGKRITHFSKIRDLVAENGNDGSEFVNLELRIALCGGKGGFGTALRKEGRKMNSKDVNKDNYRTLDGVKVGVLKRVAADKARKRSLKDDEKVKFKQKMDKLRHIVSLNPEKVALERTARNDDDCLDDLEKYDQEIRKKVVGLTEKGPEKNPKKQSKKESKPVSTDLDDFFN